MKYVCTVCGYVYDDAEHDIPFEKLPDDWTCPLCGAPKGLFEKQDDPAGDNAEKETAAPIETAEEKPVSDEMPADNDNEEDLVNLDAGELSVLFSNLARGCEKQYQAEAKSCFDKLASYFEGKVSDEKKADLETLSDLIKKDLDEEYADLRKKATAAQDRGTLRIVTWGEKVSRMAKNLVDRYIREGGGFLENTGLWVCTVCGFMYVGDNPPEICPVCKVPSWKFEKINGRPGK